MTSTMIITDDVRDLSEPELRSKFWTVANEVARLETMGEALPLAKASLHVISRELMLRRLRAPRFG